MRVSLISGFGVSTFKNLTCRIVFLIKFAFLLNYANFLPTKDLNITFYFHVYFGQLYFLSCVSEKILTIK